MGNHRDGNHAGPRPSLCFRGPADITAPRGEGVQGTQFKGAAHGIPGIAQDEHIMDTLLFCGFGRKRIVRNDTEIHRTAVGTWNSEKRLSSRPMD